MGVAAAEGPLENAGTGYLHVAEREAREHVVRPADSLIEARIELIAGHPLSRQAEIVADLPQSHRPAQDVRLPHAKVENPTRRLHRVRLDAFRQIDAATVAVVDQTAPLHAERRPAQAPQFSEEALFRRR